MRSYSHTRRADIDAFMTMIEVTGIDHIYVAVSDLGRSETFYDRVMLEVLAFRKNEFILGEDTHIQYFNRHFGFVLRPSRTPDLHDAYAPGLHHFCLRVDTIAQVQTVARQLQALGIEASHAQLHTEYAPDYWATFFEDPDGLRLEVTNYRQERRDRHEQWEQIVDRGRA